MCGIFGWVGHEFEGASQYMASGLTLLRHRGPNDSGSEVGKDWGLGFRRLSILDLSPAGHQPMSSPDGRYRLVFNGEIYNYVELREELVRQGQQFKGGSDTEVLLRLLAREWAGALPRLNGMFAFAVIDTVARRFLLARDRLGVKPLYYAVDGCLLTFASELKVLLARPGCTRSVNRRAIVEFLALGYLSSSTCIFEGYQKLAPGTYLEGMLEDPGGGVSTRYWRVKFDCEPGRIPLGANQLDDLEALLADATRIRLRSDVPVGIFLSGGIDSALVATLAARSASGAVALTVGFSESDYDESSLASVIAREAHLRHEVIHLPPASLDLLDRLAWYFDEPFGDSSALPTYALCHAARSFGTVFLAGDGGDEAFGGYRRYIEAQRYANKVQALRTTFPALREMIRILPASSVLRYRLAKVSLEDSGFAAAFDGLPGDPMLSTVLHRDFSDVMECADRVVWCHWRETRDESLLARQQYLDYELYLPDDILVKVDRASMANSIELRSPFLDYRLVEWAARLPRATLLDTKQGKLPLRALGNRLLPSIVNQAPKRGFGVPISHWFKAEKGQEFLRERLLSPEALRRHWWTEQGVKRLLALHASGKGRDFSTLLWRLAFLDAWARWYVDAPIFHRGPGTTFASDMSERLTQSPRHI